MNEAKTRAEYIAEMVRQKQRLERVALGQEKADLVLKNADYVACGASPEEIAFAVNTLKGMQGGMVVVEAGQVKASLPLEIAGLCTDRALEDVNEMLEACKTAAWTQGVNRGIDPFMTLSFASLPVIPTLRLTTKGVFNVETLSFME